MARTRSSSSSDSSDISRRNRKRRSSSHSSLSSTSSVHSENAASPEAPENVGIVPAPPEDLPVEMAREKVNLTEAEISSFRNFAKGSAPDPRLRETWFNTLPTINDVAAAAPRLDKKLKGPNYKISMTESQAIQHHEGLFSALNLLMLSNATNIRGTDNEVKYRERAMRIISVQIQDLTVLRRLSALDSLGVPSGEVSGVRRKTLDLKPEKHPNVDGEQIHQLFSSEMVEDIKAYLKHKEKNKTARTRLDFFGVITGKQSITKQEISLEVKRPAPSLDPKDLAWPKFKTIRAPLTAGRLKKFSYNWRLITKDRWVLKTVKGYALPFKVNRRKLQKHNCKILPANKALKDEAAKLLEKNAIIRIPNSKAYWISPVFLVPKKDGSQRPVINLKKLNQKICVKHFKMESLLLVKDLVTPGSFMAKIDMKDAYFALPFGLATAPRVYTKVIRPVAAFLRARGIKLIVYLDDWLFIADSAKQLRDDLRRASDLFKALGLMVNEEKSAREPVQKIEFLGLTIDSQKMCFAVPVEKQTKINTLATEICVQDQVQARKISKLCGMLASIKLASEWSSLNARHLQRCLKGIGPDTEQFDKIITVSAPAKQEGMFWAKATIDRFSKAIIPPAISLVVRTDASGQGWGCHFMSTSTGGRWDKTESKLHINILELKAAMFGLQIACKDLANTGVRLETDNAVTVAYINRRGGTKNKQLLELANELWTWALGRKLHIIASHIPGIQNVIADRESRIFAESYEWHLNPETALTLFKRWNMPEIDLFASRLNHQCANMASLTQVRIDWGFSSKAAETMMHSWAPNTIKAYESALRKWSFYCSRHDANFYDPQPHELVNFLQGLLENGLGQNAIATHRAAISSLLKAVGKGDNIQKADPFLAKFSKGLIRVKPSDPKKAEIWDVDQALDWIKSCWPLKDLSPKSLALRTTLLLALCSPKRANEIASLSLDKLRKSSSRWEFRLLITKNRKFGAPHTAKFERFKNPKLCPIENLEFYIKSTESLRKGSQLLISYQKPHAPVSSATISRWLKEALSEAGLDGFTGHSTRSAATSKAVLKGLSAAQILEAANWSKNGSTFQTFYNKEISESFQDKILGDRPHRSQPSSSSKPSTSRKRQIGEKQSFDRKVAEKQRRRR
uniref:Reverse transcriptase domain-containing protein n=1 Tax=Panagrolaimus sp. PS1159 TaxID=55785 RepID=A0AC35F1D6_9BILA